MSKKKEPAGIPKYVLHNLVEFTPGGFLLFHFNPNNGFPEHLMTFDSPAQYLAMTKYINDWCTATNKIHVAVAASDISNQTIVQSGDGEE